MGKNPHNIHRDLKDQAECLRPTLTSLSTTTLTRTRPCGQDTVESSAKEGGVDEHEQAQPRGAREEDRDEADERREEQFEPSSATRGGRELKKLKIISTF